MWETVKLGDIFETRTGGTPLKSKKEYHENGDISWLLSGAVCQKEITESNTFITQAGLDNSSARIFPANTVLVAMYGATAGQVGILRFEAATNQAVCGIYPNEKYLPAFLYYYIENYKEILLGETSGVAQPNLSQGKIKNIPIPIPPLAEQQRIVAKLDAAFAQIDKALQIVKREKLEYFKFSKAVILRKLEKIDKKSYKKFEEVCSFVRGPFGGNLKKSMFVESGYAVYEQQHPINDQFDKFRYFITSSKFDEMQRFAVNAGDVLMSCSGTLGKIGIVPSNAPEGIINQALLKITPFEGLSCDYLQLVMRSEIFQKLIWGVSGGTTQLNVPSIKTIKSLQLPMPPISEQIEIVEWAKTLQSQNLSEIYTKKYNAFGRLKSSILTQELQREAA